MSAPEHEALALSMLQRVATAYGETDYRLEKEFHSITNGSARVARECLLMMATVHLNSAKTCLRMAGWTPATIAQLLYQQADAEAGKSAGGEP